MDTLAPILITSPCQRSGTTLLVRFLNSSSNTLIYGESAANDISFLLNQLTHRKLILEYDKTKRDLELHEMLAGNLNQWLPDLLPNIDDYLKSMEQTFLKHISFFQDYAIKEKRDLWGIKQPGWTSGNINVLKNCLPNSKVVYIYRDMEACVKSAKAIQLINNFSDTKIFLEGYLQSYNAVMQLPETENLLKISFHELVERPKKTISKIKAFTGALDIDEKIVEIKVNTYFGDDRSSQSNDGYIPPVELTQNEINLVQEAKGMII